MEGRMNAPCPTCHGAGWTYKEQCCSTCLGARSIQSRKDCPELVEGTPSVVSADHITPFQFLEAVCGALWIVIIFVLANLILQ